jgi:hypothetical protein
MRYARRILGATVLLVIVVFVVAIAGTRPVLAANTGDFSLQVYPSPLSTEVKPGEKSTVELHVRNNAAETENLKITPRAFRTDSASKQLRIVEDQVPDVAKWVTFSAPIFTVASAQTFTESITFTVPKDAGFSYAFALVIERVKEQQGVPGQRSLNASVAIFSLINIDRPGAVRSLEVVSFRASNSTYEYLPAEFSVELKNTGNSIVQPSGNIFVKRNLRDTAPVATLQVNEAGGYMLPGTTRTFTATWDEGFQVVTKKLQADGSTKEELAWNWNKLGDTRIGRYAAKLVAVYDDGHRDVPLEADLSFWVIPWKMLLLALALVLLVVVGVWSLMRGVFKITRTMGGGRRKRFRL